MQPYKSITVQQVIKTQSFRKEYIDIELSTATCSMIV